MHFSNNARFMDDVRQFSGLCLHTGIGADEMMYYHITEWIFRSIHIKLLEYLKAYELFVSLNLRELVGYFVTTVLEKYYLLLQHFHLLVKSLFYNFFKRKNLFFYVLKEATYYLPSKFL